MSIASVGVRIIRPAAGFSILKRTRHLSPGIVESGSRLKVDEGLPVVKTFILYSYSTLQGKGITGLLIDIETVVCPVSELKFLLKRELKITSPIRSGSIYKNPVARSPKCR